MRRDMFRQLLERGGPELKEKLEQSEAEAMEKAKDKGISSYILPRSKIFNNEFFNHA